MLLLGRFASPLNASADGPRTNAARPCLSSDGACLSANARCLFADGPSIFADDRCTPADAALRREIDRPQLAGPARRVDGDWIRLGDAPPPHAGRTCDQSGGALESAGGAMQSADAWGPSVGNAMQSGDDRCWYAVTPLQSADDARNLAKHGSSLDNDGGNAAGRIVRSAGVSWLRANLACRLSDCSRRFDGVSIESAGVERGCHPSVRAIT